MSAPVSALAFSRVTFRRGARVVLDALDFAIATGEFVAVLGENGAGKSTLLELALGLLTPNGGSITIGGTSPRRARSHVGYVPQRLAFDADIPLRGRDFVALGVDGTRFGLPLPSAKRRRLVDETLAACGATALAERPLGRLSGGEQQRLAIAQALAREPTLLLLDEPFAALDLGHTAEIVALLAELAHGRGIAIVVVAHDVNPLARALDRVLYLEGGRAAIGPVDEVVNDDTLSRLYDRPVDVVRVRGRLVVLAGDAR